MANVKISELPVAGSASGTDKLPATQGATTRSVTVSQIIAAVPYNNLTYSGLTSGHVLKATGATSAAFSALSSTDLSDFNEAAQDAVGGILANTSEISLSYSDGTPSISAALAVTTVTPGSYGAAASIPTFTVDSKGRLTAAANIAVSILSSAVSDFDEAAQDAVGTILVDSSTIDFTYTDGTPSITASVIQSGLTFGSPSALTPDNGGSDGVSTNLARADHVHNVAAAAPSATFDLSSTNSEGVSSSFARADHSHAFDPGLVGDVSTIQCDDAAAAGVSNKFSRADHKHAIVTATPSSTGSANSEGASTSFARADHVHNTVLQNYSVQASASATTTSTSYVLCDSLSVTTPAAGTYLVVFNAQQENTNNGAIKNTFSLYKGGVIITHSERAYGFSGGAMVDANIVMIVTVTGSEDIAVYCKVASNTATIYGRSLSLVRIG